MSTNKDRAEALAAKLGVELNVLDGQEVEVWSDKARISWGGTHTDVIELGDWSGAKTMAAAYGQAIDFMRLLKPCADSCDCY